MTRRYRSLSGLIAIFALLFAQLAVAAYACPRGAEGDVVAVSASMPCGEIDPEQANLCGKHCNDVEQSQASHPPGCALPATAFTAVVYTGAPPAGGALAGDPALTHATGPPLSIRHCRFRI